MYVTPFGPIFPNNVGIGIGTPGGPLDVAAIPYNPGTVAVSGTAVTGTATEFLRTFLPGQSIVTTTTSGSETREIQTISSNTALVTVSAFAGTSTAATYTSATSGSQFVVMTHGGVRLAGTTGLSANNTNDQIYIADSITTTGTQAFAVFRDRRTYNQTTAVTSTVNSVASGPNINATSSGSFNAVRGVNSFPTVLATNTGNITTLASILSAPTIVSGATGTISSLNGLLILGTNSSTTNTVTNWYGVNVNPTQAGGTLTNYAGIAINAKPTAATNSSLLLVGTTTIPSGSYAVYSSSTLGAYFSGPMLHGQYTLATLPSAAAFSGYQIDVTDATGGAKTCRSDGSFWKILNTTTTVS